MFAHLPPSSYSLSLELGSGWHCRAETTPNQARGYRNRKPCEDAFEIFEKGGTIFAVIADGVTRIGSPDGRYATHRMYPDPSPAQEIARHVVSLSRSIFPFQRALHPNLEEALCAGVGEINRQVRLWNEERMGLDFDSLRSNCDFADHDPAATTLVVVAIEGDSLAFASIGDSLAYVARESGEVTTLAKKPNNTAESKLRRLPGLLRKLILNASGVNNPRVSDDVWRRSIEIQRGVRRDDRNNPDARRGFGAITGEEAALRFLTSGTNHLGPQDHVILSSDGLEGVLHSASIQELRKGTVNPGEIVAQQVARELIGHERSDDKTIILLWRDSATRQHAADLHVLELPPLETVALPVR